MPPDKPYPESQDLHGSTVSYSRLSEELSEVRVPALTILCHPDPRRVGERALLPALGSGDVVALSRLAPELTSPAGGPSRPLADKHLSRRPLELALEPGVDGLTLRRGQARGVEVDGVTLDDERRVSTPELAAGVTLVLAERVALLLHLQVLRPRGDAPSFGLVGESAAVVRLREQIREIGPVEVPVLLRGETGTGKELVAHAVHRASRRRDHPMVCVNMAALAPSLASAELFGAARGAYTGADRKRAGYFRRATGGTLFLDEIGETPVEVQVLLLRALETGEVQPVGASDPIRVDVRVVAATDAELESAVASGRFRAPLLHRLTGTEIRLPSLAERREDVGRLLCHFLRKELEALGEAHRLDPAGPRDRPWLDASLVARLTRYSWPGNVRQLRNVARQLAITGRGAPQLRLTPEIAALLGESATAPEPVAVATRERPAALLPGGDPGETVAPPAQPKKQTRRPSDIDEDELLEVLRAHLFRPRPTADALGISRTSLYALIDRSSRIRKAGDLAAEEIEACRRRCAGDLDAMATELEVSRKGLRRRMTDLGLR